MKKRLLLVMMVPAICIFLILPALSQEEMQLIEDDGFQKRQRPAAAFKHDEHNELAEVEACNECHHIYEDGEKTDDSSEDQGCSDCHEREASGNTPALMKAFHMNCKGCHVDRKQGPIMCGECHVKKTLT